MFLSTKKDWRRERGLHRHAVGKHGDHWFRARCLSVRATPPQVDLGGVELPAGRFVTPPAGTGPQAHTDDAPLASNKRGVFFKLLQVVLAFA